LIGDPPPAQQRHEHGRTNRALYARPEWPGVQAGLTIGIGCDLRFVDAAHFKADWG